MLTLTLLPEEFGICRLDSRAATPTWVADGPFVSITRTADELSIVCPARVIPVDATASRGWRCLKVHGPLDFNLTGALLSLAEPLAQVGVSIFALSTYDTDYVLVRDRDLAKAIAALRGKGHIVHES